MHRSFRIGTFGQGMKRFQKYVPDERLQAYVKAFYVSENPDAETYKVLPVTGIVLGFQYAGSLTLLQGSDATVLSRAGVTGFTDRFRIYSNSAGIGTVLVYLTATGFSGFTNCPASHLFAESIALDHLFGPRKVNEVTDRLSAATTDHERITIVEHFLLSELKARETLPLLNEAVYRIYQSKGAVQIGALGKQLYISQSALERRFKLHIGVTPKKFASIVRFNHILEDLKSDSSLIDICYGNNYFDQAHFIKDFKHFTGHAPDEFRKTH